MGFAECSAMLLFALGGGRRPGYLGSYLTSNDTHLQREAGIVVDRSLARQSLQFQDLRSISFLEDGALADRSDEERYDECSFPLRIVFWRHGTIACMHAPVILVYS